MIFVLLQGSQVIHDAFRDALSLNHICIEIDWTWLYGLLFFTKRHSLILRWDMLEFSIQSVVGAL
jgi:hypothetical protein